MVAGKLDDVIVGPDRHVAGKRQLRDQRSERNLSLGIHIGDGVYEKAVLPNLHLIPLISQLSEIGTTIYQWL